MEKDSKNKNKLKNLQYMYETKPKKMIMVEMNVLTVPKSFYKFVFESKISRFQDSRNKTPINALQSSSFKTSGNRLTF